MFRKFWWITGARSDSGFSIRLKGLHNVEYREGDKLLIAFRERLHGDPSMELDSRSIQSWEPPNEGEDISPDEKSRILQNICDALDFLGLTYVIR